MPLPSRQAIPFQDTYLSHFLAGCQAAMTTEDEVASLPKSEKVGQPYGEELSYSNQAPVPG